MASLLTSITDLDDLTLSGTNLSAVGTTGTATFLEASELASDIAATDIDATNDATDTTVTVTVAAGHSLKTGDVVAITASDNSLNTWKGGRTGVQLDSASGHTITVPTDSTSSTVFTYVLPGETLTVSNATGDVFKDYITINGSTNYNGRYLASPAVGNVDAGTTGQVLFYITGSPAAENLDSFAGFFDDNDGVFYSPEIEIDANHKWIILEQGNASGDLTEEGTGVQGQALYSLLKDRWKEMTGLTRYDFPMLSITNEQFEFIDGWTPYYNNGSSNTTRKLIRTAGWSERNAAGLVTQTNSGIITLGTLGLTDQPYFVQNSSTIADTTNTNYTGPVNEGVTIFAGLSATQGNVSTSSGVLTVKNADAGIFKTNDVVNVTNTGSTNVDGTYKVGTVTQQAAPVKIEYIDGSATQIKIRTAAAHGVAQDDIIKISGTQRYDGTYTVGTDTDDTANFLTIADTTHDFAAELNTGDIQDLESTIVLTDNVTGDNISDLTSGTVAGAITVELNAQSVFNIFVRERGKTYADSNLGDIGVTNMTSIVYRFPVTNATDLNINTTDDAAFTEAAIASIASDGTTWTINTSVDHGLYTGAPVQIENTTSNLYDGDFIVASVPSSVQFTITNSNDLADQAGAAGTSRLNFTDAMDLEYIPEQYVITAAESNGTQATITIGANNLEVGDLVYLQGSGLATDTGTPGTASTYKAVTSRTSTQITYDTTDNTGSATLGTDPTLTAPFRRVTFGNSTLDNAIQTNVSPSITYPNILFATGKVIAPNTVVYDDNDDRFYISRAGGTTAGANTGADTGVTDWKEFTKGAPTGANDVQDGSYYVENVNTYSAYGTIYDLNTAAEANADGLSVTPGATKEVAYEYAQYLLRQTTNIDINDSQKGSIAEPLVQFVGSTLETLQGVFAEQIANADVNNIQFYDYGNVTHLYPLVVAVNINFNSNLSTDVNARFYVYFTDVPDGEFGTNFAIEVQDSQGNFVGRTLQNDSNGVMTVANQVPQLAGGSSYTFNFAYDGNSQGGRTLSTDTSVTTIGIGLDTAQYVTAVSTITNAGATISLVAPLERNYTDPND